jgi:tetratricopeptide (TPR) repeat protein
MMLALAVARPGTVGAESADGPSTLVVTASDSADANFSQPSISGSADLVVYADDSETSAAAVGGQAASPQATLSVVANGQRQKPVAEVVFDPHVTPAAAARRPMPKMPPRASWGTMFPDGPNRPSAAAGIQSRQQQRANVAARRVPRQPAAPLDVSASSAGGGAARMGAAPSRQQTPAAGAPRPVQPDQPTDPASQRLVRAYELSLTASAEAEYSQIVTWCAEALHHGLRGENRQFALELSAWALNRRGQARADQGQPELAISDFRAALEFDPACWRALHNRGVTLAQNGQFAEAFDDISKVIEFNPQFAKAYSNRATLYVQAGDFEKALVDYDAALRIDPSLLQALIGRARVCHMTGRLEEALTSFNAAVEHDAASAEIVCSRGDLLVDLGRYSEALQDYARAIDLDAKFEHAYRNGAWLLATCPDDAVRDAEGALRGAQAALECGYGDRHAALDTLAAALANAGRFEEAVGTMQQAIEIAPEDAVPAYQARQQLYESGQPFRTHPVDPIQEAEFIEG